MANTNRLEPEQSLFNAYCAHTTGNRIHTDSAIQKALIETYPGRSVVATNCDLIKYAQAGHATAQLVENGSPHLFHRDFEPTINRANNGDDVTGILKTTTIFACYRFDWQGHTLLVYLVEGQTGPVSFTRRHYILAKPSDGETMGEFTSTVSDSLILAAGTWEERGGNAVWFFDRGRWVKDQELSLAMQNVSYDDVILPKAMKAAIEMDIIGFLDSKSYYREFNIPWKVRLWFLRLYSSCCSSNR
jgi:hypothetical protein